MSARLTLLSLAANAALRDGRRRLARRMALTALAATLAFLALLFLLLAAFLWLSARLPPQEAALILSGALALPAALLLALARAGLGRPVEDRLRADLARLYGSARDEVRERPAMPLMGAGLAGVVLGLLLMDRR